MLQVFNVVAGGRMVNAKANFFRYESCLSSGTDETLKVRADGSDLGTYLPGDSIELPAQVQTWEFTPVSPIATSVVRLGLGKISSSRVIGDVAITDQVRGICQTVNVSNGTPGFTADQIIAPASNVRGVVIRTAQAEATAAAGGACNVRLIAATTAPVSLAGSAQQLIVVSILAPAGAQKELNLFELRRLIPVGWGLWMAKACAVSPISCNVTASIEVL